MTIPREKASDKDLVSVFKQEEQASLRTTVISVCPLSSFIACNGKKKKKATMETKHFRLGIAVLLTDMLEFARGKI